MVKKWQANGSSMPLHSLVVTTKRIGMMRYEILSTLYCCRWTVCWHHTKLLRNLGKKHHGQVVMDQRRWNKPQLKDGRQCKGWNIYITWTMNLRPTLHCNTSPLRKLLYGVQDLQPHATSLKKLSHASDSDFRMFCEKSLPKRLRRRSCPSLNT